MSASEIAAAYDRNVAAVHDLTRRLAASEGDADAITRETFARLVEHDLVRVPGDIAGRLLATAYHEAARHSQRAMQPIAAGTHMLPDDLVATINAHARRCRSCRRWGPLPMLGITAMTAPPLEPALEERLWQEIASRIDTTPPARAETRLVAATVADRVPAPFDAPFGRRFKIAAMTAVVLLVAAAGIGVALLARDGDGEPIAPAVAASNNDDAPDTQRTSETEAEASDEDGATTPTPTAASGDQPENETAPLAGGDSVGGASGNAAIDNGDDPASQPDDNQQEQEGSNDQPPSAPPPSDDGVSSEDEPPPAAQTEPPASDTPPPPPASSTPTPAAPTSTPPPPATPTPQPPTPTPTSAPAPVLPLVPTVISVVETVLPLQSP